VVDTMRRKSPMIVCGTRQRPHAVEPGLDAGTLSGGSGAPNIRPSRPPSA
jgi:hypothetical protein